MNENPDKVQKFLDFKSHYDKSRDTVGKMYRDAHLNNTEDFIEIGDMARELTTGLVEDINDAIENFDKKGKPYYLMVEEKKDLQMKTAVLRRIHYFGFRPWPEDNTTVFWKDPRTQDLRFCWCLPHWSEMDLTLQNAHQYDREYIRHIKAWKDFNLWPFGFVSTKDEGWLPNPKWQDRRLDSYKRKVDIQLAS